MSWGPCKACPKAVAAWMMSPGGVATVPESVLFCLDHLKILLKGRSDASLRDARNASRRWCACGNEIYLLSRSIPETPGFYVPRTTCAACTTGGTATVSRPFGDLPVEDQHRLSVKVPDDWYSSMPCHDPDCTAKMVYFYPALDVAMCAKHGAAAEPEDAHA